MAAIFDLPLNPMSDSVHTHTTELLDPENVDVAFGISLLRITEEADLLHYFILTYGNGGHLCFTSHPDVGQCSH